MQLSDRQEKILTLLKKQGAVDVDALASLFSVSVQTVRRDLGDLCTRGLATRTHGGARRMVSASSLGYEERRILNSDSKQAIGAAAAELIPDGASVMLNIGTTTEQVARALTAHRDLVVVSNNVNVINILISAQMKELVLVGGSVRPSDGAVVGEDAVEFISRYKTDFAVIGTSSIDADGSILDFDNREVSVARAILRNSRTKILVVDASKFETSAPFRICDVSDLDYVISDKRPPETFLDAAARGKTRVIYLDEENEHST